MGVGDSPQLQQGAPALGLAPLHFQADPPIISQVSEEMDAAGLVSGWPLFL
jgi:hypothetical protein